MLKTKVVILTMVSMFSMSHAQFLDDDIAAIERIQNQKYREQQQAQKAAAARQAKINAERAAKQAKIDAERAARQAKIDAENEARKIKMDHRDDENYELEMEIKRMELMARKKELEQKARNYDLDFQVESAQAERQAAIEKARLKQADAFIEEELAAQRTRRDVLQSEADATRNVSEGVKSNLSKKGFFEKE
ncbi:Hypothetical protein F387_01392 [Wohlfahrtiimonas chitiniclastica SH04]|uniref:Uncharacterized protein n=1 Tax=Wohlfahrtiimonas chitiniclastica SH04 TaxID=1261130 RepID=L8XU97_9GAMM|nr:DUF5384 family protein [Wohlfahrtiimonas chitiniclastica]ELV07588.1 Hypothetical protein F387_01392 [Wohlfahrtiimonas chitiniclastica SH04]MBS7814845.1 DUF5384 family protein [Wohlfahrtiimonas chitiniclastica]